MTNEQRYEQHKRDGGTLTFEQFVARKPRKKKPRSYRVFKKRYDRDAALDLACDVYGDLPDGAFWAAAGDTFGVDPADLFEGEK